MNCLIENCRRVTNPDLRGLCLIHHKEARILVEAGQTTWDELEAAGLAVPRKPAGEPTLLDRLNSARGKHAS